MADIQQQAAWLKQQTHMDYALFYPSSYPFAVTLFALLAANKRIWIPGNNRPATAKSLQQQGCQLLGEWPDSIQIPESTRVETDLGFDASRSRLIIHTSGSSGQPKAIIKTLTQLEAEIKALECLWGRQLAGSAIAATVSHQHIYGLLFKLLWPLAAGRCFFSAHYLSPEALLKTTSDKPCCWIASPAQLKRLDSQSPWPQIATLTAVFSSGGPLPAAAAEKLFTRGGQSVIEVYGSSETGGIAWRQQHKSPLWQPLPGVELSQKHGSTRVLSPWLNETITLDDDLSFPESGYFILNGRKDNIVKIEEKRLSLTEMEQILAEHPEIESARVFLLSGQRERLAAALVLTPQGFDRLKQIGRSAWIKQQKPRLLEHFESVMTPKKWLFLNRYPETSQGKTDIGLLTSLFNQDKNRFPVIQSLWLEKQAVKLQINIHDKLGYFSGHFPDQPILPGVTQLAWADHYGHIFFTIAKGFNRLEAVKFKKTIAPNTLATLSISWKEATQKLYFELSSDSESFGSGRMIFQAPL